jgi:cob(I)alamin adenosyltransferase
MVNLTRIYTKTGDDGTTSLGDMSRTSKNDPRLEAYATVDEANSSIGVVLSTDGITDDVRALLVRIQNDLFDVGADLCTPVVDSPAFEPLRVLESQISYLEEQIDKYNADLEALRSFVLPFGGGVNPLTAKYLNRCSDLLFVLARYANKEIGDQLWVPGANR